MTAVAAEQAGGVHPAGPGEDPLLLPQPLRAGPDQGGRHAEGEGPREAGLA